MIENLAGQASSEVSFNLQEFAKPLLNLIHTLPQIPDLTLKKLVAAAEKEPTLAKELTNLTKLADEAPLGYGLINGIISGAGLGLIVGTILAGPNPTRKETLKKPLKGAVVGGTIGGIVGLGVDLFHG